MAMESAMAARISSVEVNGSSGSTTAISSSSATISSARASACARSYGPTTTGSHSASSVLGPKVMIHGKPFIGESSARSRVTSTPTRTSCTAVASTGAQRPHNRRSARRRGRLVGLRARRHRRRRRGRQLIRAYAGGQVKRPAAYSGGGQRRTEQQQLAEQVDEDQQPDRPAGELVRGVVLGVPDEYPPHAAEQAEPERHQEYRRQQPAHRDPQPRYGHQQAARHHDVEQEGEQLPGGGQ